VEYFSQQSTEVVSREHLQRVALWQRLDLLPPPIEARRAKLLSKTIRRLLWGVFGPRSVRALPAQTSADRFLDIGCGVGIRLDMAADLCWRTYGIDLSGEAVAQARSRGHQAALSGAEVLPFADQSMVYVNLSHVLEHTFDPVAAFKEARRVLRPGGLIDVAVPNAGAWSARRLGASWGPYDAPRHLYHFTPLTLQALAKTAGLDALLIRTVAEAWGLRRSKPNPAVDDPITQADRRMQALQARFRQGDELQMWCTRGIRS
jgi:SAM-dependent methyltransferase